MSRVRKKAKHFLDHHVWNIDLDTLSRAKSYLVKSIRFFFIAVREFREGELTLRAMSLVYTTMLSIVPLIAVSFSVLKAFGVHNMAEPFLRNLFKPLGEKGVEITSRIIIFVDNIKAGILGSIGLAFLIFTIISLIQKIEMSFNNIWKIRKARSFAQSFSNYLSITLIGPLLVFAAIGLTASVTSTTIVQKIIALEPFGTVFYVWSKVLPYILVCLAFTMIYIFVPNTKVKFSSALVGGIFAGIFWETTGWAFASFIAKSTKYAAIYSSFAILILFMIWLYLSWLVLLIGCEIAFYHQYPQFLVVGKERFQLSNRLKERVAFLLFVLIGYNFHNGRPGWTLDALIHRLGIPVEPIQDILMLLEEKKLITETYDDPPRYVPAQDLEMIRVADFIRTIRGAEEVTFTIEDKFLSTPEVDKVVNALSEALEVTLGDQSMKDIVLQHREGSDIT